MSLFLSPYIGAGTLRDPFRPTGLDQPGSSAVDIRLDPTRADGNGIGFALLWLPVGIPDPVGAIKIADDYGDLLTSQQRTRLNQRTGLEFSADTTIQDAIETVMLRADTLRWKRIRPANGVYEVWLGSGSGKRKWIDLPAIAGGSISDNFNRANETPIAAPWTKLSGATGDINLSSNAITHTPQGDCLYYYANSAGWSADQSSEWTYASLIDGGEDWGPAVRVGSNGYSAYFWSQWTGGREFYKTVNNVTTSLASTSGSAAVSDVIKVTATGSSLAFTQNGTPHASSPVTDTALATAGSGPGVFYWNAGGSLDTAVLTGELTQTVTWVGYIG